MLVRADRAALRADAKRLKPATCRIRVPSGGEKHLVAGNFMHAVCVFVNDRPLRDALDAGIYMKLHAVFLIRLHQKLAALRVGRARDFGHQLDHDDLCADGGKIAGHL